MITLSQTRILWLLVAPVVAAMNNTLAIDDLICIEGFVMDRFCIDRGTLVDNPQVETLVEPEVHSVHCLIDVSSCINSEYEILFEPNDISEGKYRRAFFVDQKGHDDLVSLAASTGFNGGNCAKCTNSSSDAIQNGFRAAIRGRITSMPTDMLPAGIEVIESQFGVSASDICENFEDYKVVTDVDFTVMNNSFRNMAIAHGSLMLIGWGLLLPMGAIFAKLFKHRPDGLWFKIHRAMQTFGLVLAIIGWIIALTNFSVFGDVGQMNYNHGVMGMTVMVIGLLQPLNAVIRPHPPKDGEEKEAKRLYWEILHKGMGYAGLLLAIATIGIGTTLVVPSDQRAFQFAYGLGVGLCLLILIFALCIDKKKYSQYEGGEAKEEGKQSVPEQVAEDAA